MAPVIRALQESSYATVSVCAVNQQREILRSALAEWGIEPVDEVSLAQEEASSTSLAAVIHSCGVSLERRDVDLVLVHGDTTTATGAALAANYAGISVAHVEAGLRTGDLRNPFPEEMHRVVISRLAALHFAPTERARRNLLSEGCADEQVFVVGNTVVDALKLVRDSGSTQRSREILVTCHRRENFGGGVQRICAALLEVMADFPDVTVRFVLHPNPNTSSVVRRMLRGHPQVTLTPSLSYHEFVHRLKMACFVITDSGGIQEEAPFFGTPVLITRDTTERPEVVEAGRARLVSTDSNLIRNSCRRLLSDPAFYAGMSAPSQLFGDGEAARRIVSVLAEWWSRSARAYSG